MFNTCFPLSQGQSWKMLGFPYIISNKFISEMLMYIFTIDVWFWLPWNIGCVDTIDWITAYHSIERDISNKRRLKKSYTSSLSFLKGSGQDSAVKKFKSQFRPFRLRFVKLARPVNCTETTTSSKEHQSDIQHRLTII